MTSPASALNAQNGKPTVTISAEGRSDGPSCLRTFTRVGSLAREGRNWAHPARSLAAAGTTRWTYTSGVSSILVPEARSVRVRSLFVLGCTTAVVVACGGGSGDGIPGASSGTGSSQWLGDVDGRACGDGQPTFSL